MCLVGNRLRRSLFVWCWQHRFTELESYESIEGTLLEQRRWKHFQSIFIGTLPYSWGGKKVGPHTERGGGQRSFVFSSTIALDTDVVLYDGFLGVL